VTLAGTVVTIGERCARAPRHQAHTLRSVHQARAPARRQLVTVVIEDTHYRVLHGEEELDIRPRRDTAPITRQYIRGKGIQRGGCQEPPEDKRLSMS
jgi:hypothetical protein